MLAPLLLEPRASDITTPAGVTASYVWDLPTGATVVCAFGVSLILCALLRAGLTRA